MSLRLSGNGLNYLTSRSRPRVASPELHSESNSTTPADQLLEWSVFRKHEDLKIQGVCQARPKNDYLHMFLSGCELVSILFQTWTILQLVDSTAHINRLVQINSFALRHIQILSPNKIFSEGFSLKPIYHKLLTIFLVLVLIRSPIVAQLETVANHVMLRFSIKWRVRARRNADHFYCFGEALFLTVICWDCFRGEFQTIRFACFCIVAYSFERLKF